MYRKLQQDVAGFWQFLKREAVRGSGEENAGRMVWLASRLVGRWPSGTPLVLAPHSDNPLLTDRNDFLYREDADGLSCPLGAHIRRANPRDDIKPYPSAESLSMSEAHRLLRRARVFGPPLFDAAVLRDPTSAACRAAIMALADDGRARGIHFFCVNASIRSQFEFVQQTWCNNPRFGGLNDNKDPITGDNDRTDQPSSHMTIPGRWLPHGSVASLRHGQGRRVSVHAEHQGAAFSGSSPSRNIRHCSRRPSCVAALPMTTQIARSAAPLRISEREPVLEQSGRDNPTAL